MAVLFKENYYVIAKVINFVVDSPARKMKAKNKRMHYLYSYCVNV